MAASTASARPRSATCGTWSPARRARAMSTRGCCTSWRPRAQALEGKVFDVLGALFEQHAAAQAAGRGHPLRRPARGARPAGAGGRQRRRPRSTCASCWRAASLVADSMDTTADRCASARRWSATPPGACSPTTSSPSSCRPSRRLGGAISEREPGRYRISYVPARIRNRAKELGTAVPVWETYDRVCFDKELMNQAGPAPGRFHLPRPSAAGYRHRPGAGPAPRAAALRRGAGRPDRPRHLAARPLLPGAEHPAMRAAGQRRRLAALHLPRGPFCRDRRGGQRPRPAATRPTSTIEPATAEELAQIAAAAGRRLAGRRGAGGPGGGLCHRRTWSRATWTACARRREEQIDKTLAAVHERLTKEINYWDRQADRCCASRRRPARPTPRSTRPGPAARRRTGRPPGAAHPGAGPGAADLGHTAGGDRRSRRDPDRAAAG